MPWRVHESCETPLKIWMLLHLFFAFSYVGTLIVAEWNGRAARATTDWSQRALLFQIVFLSARVAGIGSLVLLGVFGNIVAPKLGHSMAHDPWMRIVNTIWIASVLTVLFFTLPNAGRLTRIARDAAAGGDSSGYGASLTRWRIGNVLQSVLYLALLVLMVFHANGGGPR